MQTFVPYADFAASAAVLDDRRLGKQRVEALQIVRALTWETSGWKHHPAVLMWVGHEEAGAAYGLAIAREWVARGKADTCAATIALDLADAGFGPARSEEELVAADALPFRWGDDRVHHSHRCALVRKDPETYAARFEPLDAETPYVWPVRKGDLRTVITYR